MIWNLGLISRIRDFYQVNELQVCNSRLQILGSHQHNAQSAFVSNPSDTTALVCHILVDYSSLVSQTLFSRMVLVDWRL